MELKPCPFCGGKAEIWVRKVKPYKEYWIRCIDCGGESPTREKKESAVEGWNRRWNDG